MNHEYEKQTTCKNIDKDLLLIFQFSETHIIKTTLKQQQNHKYTLIHHEYHESFKTL